MSKTWILAAALALAFATVCEAGPLDSFSGSFEENHMESENRVYTEIEMADFALERLEEKYHKPFEIESSGRMYGHQDGKENKPVSLRAYAHPAGNEEERFFLIVTEPDSFRDNYWVYEYKQEVTKLVEKQLEPFGLKAVLEIDYPVTAEKPSPDLTAEELLHDPECILFFEPRIENQKQKSDYIPVIRQWMEFLYPLDYNWYFELHRDPDDALIFTLDPGDNGFKSSEDWKDELLESYIRLD